MDPFYYHNPGTRVNVNTNRNNDSVETGKELPLLVQSEIPSASTMLIDSANRYSGNSADFRVKMNTVMRPRYYQMKRIVLPKIPNVNANNNSITIVHDDGTFTIALDNGIYNTTTLANELTSKINAGLATLISNDSVTTTYNTNTRNFTIISVTPANWYFLDTSTFIIRGLNLAGFIGYPAGTALTVSSHSSGIAGMLYCKYISISSQMLTQYSYSSSITSNPTNRPQLVGVADMTSIYSAADFDVSVPYSGVYNAIDVWAPNISAMSSQKCSFSDIDFLVQDEYGLPINLALDIGITSSLSIVMIFNISF